MTTASPRVSVILPTYNRARLLPRAIASVLNQSWRDLELIIVDDGSTDDTAAVVAGFADPRVRYLPPLGNLGDAGARNRGLAAARGEWLAFQDSDDEWLLHRLDWQMRQLMDATSGWAGVASVVLRLAGRQIDYIAWRRQAGSEAGPVTAVDVDGFVYEMTAYLQGLIVRRDVAQALGGFDTQLRARSDFDFCLRLVQQYPVGVSDEPVAVSHESPTSISALPDYQLADIRYLLQRHATGLARHPQAHARYQYLLGRALVLAGHGREALQALVAAVCRNPRYCQAWALLMLLLLCGTARIARFLTWRVQRYSTISSRNRYANTLW